MTDADTPDGMRPYVGVGSVVSALSGHSRARIGLLTVDGDGRISALSALYALRGVERHIVDESHQHVGELTLMSPVDHHLGRLGVHDHIREAIAYVSISPRLKLVAAAPNGDVLPARPTPMGSLLGASLHRPHNSASVAVVVGVNEVVSVVHPTSGEIFPYYGAIKATFEADDFVDEADAGGLVLDSAGNAAALMLAADQRSVFLAPITEVLSSWDMRIATEPEIAAHNMRAEQLEADLDAQFKALHQEGVAMVKELREEREKRLAAQSSLWGLFSRRRVAFGPPRWLSQSAIAAFTAAGSER